MKNYSLVNAYGNLWKNWEHTLEDYQNRVEGIVDWVYINHPRFYILQEQELPMYHIHVRSGSSSTYAGKMLFLGNLRFHQGVAVTENNTYAWMGGIGSLLDYSAELVSYIDPTEDISGDVEGANQKDGVINTVSIPYDVWFILNHRPSNTAIETLSLIFSDDILKYSTADGDEFPVSEDGIIFLPYDITAATLSNQIYTILDDNNNTITFHKYNELILLPIGVTIYSYIQSTNTLNAPNSIDRLKIENYLMFYAAEYMAYSFDHYADGCIYFTPHSTNVGLSYNPIDLYNRRWITPEQQFSNSYNTLTIYSYNYANNAINPYIQNNGIAWTGQSITQEIRWKEANGWQEPFIANVTTKAISSNIDNKEYWSYNITVENGQKPIANQVFVTLW